ncbi:MAG: aminotransferase class III-fold pyridoxal phosphate-dependent enzyme, partial [Blastocatellia bacterium]|nr:aminotransferase class III-fold pyridoxal phosphate-dependent enzyme [Blastocatellia bacterium]
EAVEAALKFSRLSTGRTEVVAAMRGFHGRTYGALSATWEREYRKPFEPLVPNFLHIPFNNIEAAQTAISEKTAAIIVEIVQGEGGVRPGSGEYFQTLQQLCSKTGTLLILDEVQTGFGRTGKMFAYEHYDLKPDIVCLGKSIAGGLAMGAVALGERVATLPPKAHGSTFGGNPVASAAAIATIEVFERDQLAERARHQGDFLLESLRKIDSPLIREVRGLGLLVGIELKLRVTPLLQKLMKRGILALPAGSTVLRLLPPLVISRSDLEQVVVNIEESLAELEKETNR